MLEIEWSNSSQTAWSNPMAESPTNRMTAHKNLCVAMRHSPCQNSSPRFNSKRPTPQDNNNEGTNRNQQPQHHNLRGWDRVPGGLEGCWSQSLGQGGGCGIEGGAKTRLGMRRTPLGRPNGRTAVTMPIAHRAKTSKETLSNQGINTVMRRLTTGIRSEKMRRSMISSSCERHRLYLDSIAYC
jgi:hypothetical protein